PTRIIQPGVTLVSDQDPVGTVDDQVVEAEKRSIAQPCQHFTRCRIIAEDVTPEQSTISICDPKRAGSVEDQPVWLSSISEQLRHGPLLPSQDSAMSDVDSQDRPVRGHYRSLQERSHIWSSPTAFPPRSRRSGERQRLGEGPERAERC